MSEIEPADRTNPDRAESLFRDCLGAFRHIRLTVTGACMGPALMEGEGVLLTHPTRHPPRFGDVVLVRLPQGLRLHRVIFRPPRALGWAWRTKGDRSPAWDPPIPSGGILGTVIGVVGETRPTRGLAAASFSLAAALLARFRQFFPGGTRA